MPRTTIARSEHILARLPNFTQMYSATAIRPKKKIEPSKIQGHAIFLYHDLNRPFNMTHYLYKPCPFIRGTLKRSERLPVGSKILHMCPQRAHRAKRYFQGFRMVRFCTRIRTLIAQNSKETNFRIDGAWARTFFDIKFLF